MENQENKCLSDITFSYKHPSGKEIGKLEYDEDMLILRYKGGVIMYPELDKLIIIKQKQPENNSQDIMLANVIIQLDKWIEQCETQAEIFRENKMDTAEISSQAMSQAYWNVKQFIEVNNHK